jgi:hypothetical protein
MNNQLKHPGRGGVRRGVGNGKLNARYSHFFHSTNRPDFKAINDAALDVLPILLARWLPNGRRIGREYVALNPKGADRHLGSFKIALSGSRSGMWADFATGDKGGDVISLAAYLFVLSQTEAAKKIAKMLGLAQ